MEEVKLATYLSKWPFLANIIFPRDSEGQINCKEFKEMIDFEDREGNEHVAQFLFDYMDMIEQRKQGKSCLL